MKIEEIMEKERWATEEALIKGNFNAMVEANVFDPDVEVYIPPLAKLKGLDAFIKFLKGMTDSGTLSETQWEWNDIILQNDTAVQSFTYSGMHTDPNIEKTGSPTVKRVILEGCAFYYIKNNKIAKFKEFSNYLGFFQQIGVIPPIG